MTEKAALVKYLRFQQVLQLHQTEKKFNQACKQILLLNGKLTGLNSRYLSAKAEGVRGFRYNLRIRIAVTEGIRNVYYDYARIKAEEIAGLRRELYDQAVLIVSDSDSEDSDTDTLDLDPADQESADQLAADMMETDHIDGVF